MNLITGATGIVGAQVALQLLQKGEPVSALKRPGSNTANTLKLFSYYTQEANELFARIRWVDGDVTDIFSLLDALDGIETVYHCAGFVSFNAKDHKALYKINAEGTANVVNACFEKSVALCHVSSIATLQNPDIATGIDESVYWKSSPEASDYAISKYNGEREVWRGIEEGLKAVIVNPGFILSPGFWKQSSGKLITSCYKGTAFFTRGSTGFVNVKDVAACMIALMEKKCYGERYVLIENNYSFKEVFTLLHQRFGKKPPTIEAGSTLLHIGKWLDALRSKIAGTEQLITKETVIAGLSKNTYSNKKITAALSHRFIPLNESIAFISKAYLQDLKL